MLFNSLHFLIFFPIVLIVYYIFPDKVKNYWLLVCSYYFYMGWNAKYAVLIMASTIITFVSGIFLEKAKRSKALEENKERNKKIIVAVSFLLNLAILFYFKYFNFTIDILKSVFGIFHVNLNIPGFDIMLPVGISFYTFQALSYTMDVYRDEIYAEKNFFKYALFVSFFPQLVAGPIERSKNLLKQLSQYNKFDFSRFIDGLLLMIWGYFLKLVLADRIAIFVDMAYGDINKYPGFYLIVATVLFAVQIYCDFAGYSTIAMGAAAILGIKLMENFDAPYLSVSVAEFWRRWHISLTSWFKDYLYIPLGGSRKGKTRKYINKIIVFLVSGLWHGADLSYVVWGGLNGCYQIIGEMLMPLRNCMVKLFNLNRQSVGHKVVHMAGTFILVDFAWIFFRAGSFRYALNVIRQMFHNNAVIFWNGELYNCGLDSKNFGLMVFSIVLLFIADIFKKKNISLRNILQKQDSWCLSVIIAFSVSAILLFGIWGPGYNEANFIYFQF